MTKFPVEFEPGYDADSSPSAWSHYRIVYADSLGKTYDIENPTVRNHVKIAGQHLYTDIQTSSNACRLVAIKNGTPKTTTINGTNYFYADLRLGGETDFNFGTNNKSNKYEAFRKLISKEYSGDELDFYLNMLDKCKSMHHSLENFSLMQVMGKLQQLKGRDDFDRFDVFISKLAKYFKGDPEVVQKIHGFAGETNASYLSTYLSSFPTVEDYCAQVYFISDVQLIRDLILSGNQPITHGHDVVRYMQLAFRYWNQKAAAFREYYFECPICGEQKPLNGYSTPDMCDECRKDGD